MQIRSSSATGIRILEEHYDRHFPISGPRGLYEVPEKRSTLHVHNGLEIGYCYQGSGVFFVDHKVLPFQAGDISVIFPNEAHIAQSRRGDPSQWKFFSVHLPSLLLSLTLEHPAELLTLGEGSQSFDNVLSPQVDGPLCFLARELMAELTDQKPGYEDLVRSYLWAFARHLSRKPEFRESGSRKTDQQMRGIRAIGAALEHVSRHYSEEIEVKVLADLCFLSVPHFSRVFKTVMKVSPMEFVFAVRIKMAGVLLKSQPASVLDIAYEVGYSSITSFNRHFKRLKGVTPQQWRSGSEQR